MRLTVTATATGGGTCAAFAVRVLRGAAAVVAQHGKTGTAAFGPSPPDLAITPNATGSYIYGAQNQYPGTVTFTPTGATTYSSNWTDSALSYGTFRSTAKTTAATPVTLGGSAPTGAGDGCIALAEILAAGVLAEDTSSPAAVTGDGTSQTTAAFNPPGGALLIAMATGSGAGADVLAVTDSAGLTWTRLAYVGNSGDGSSGIWIARAPGAGTGGSGSIVPSLIAMGGPA